MRSINGFTLIEVLVAMSIIFVLVATIIPIDIVLKQGRKTLQDKREITLHLHDTLLHYISTSELINVSTTETINGTFVTIHFTEENEYIKGCATWENARDKHEQICLYGLRQ